MSVFTPGPIFGWPRKEVIDRDGDPYLTRWHLVSTRARGRVFLHRFHRSDEDVLHDHPWAFWSLILWGGYFEWTPGPNWPPRPLSSMRAEVIRAKFFPEAGTRRRWYGPGSFLRRPADWRHRVDVPVQLRSRVWTLVWTGPKVRSWGFWCPQGWRPYKEHHKRRDVTGDGCA